jgi:hypothetical protein
VAKSHVAGDEVAHIGAKNARKTKRDPVARAERRQMDVLHGTFSNGGAYGSMGHHA